MSLLETAKAAVKLALAKGAKEASASAYRDREVELSWRDGKVEKVSEATTRGVSLALYVDGRYSSVSTSDLRPDALSAFVEESIALTRTLTVDPYRALPDPKLYEGRASVDLEIWDKSHASVTPEVRLKRAKAIEEAARSHDKAGAILSVTTSAWDSESTGARVTSNGFEGERRSTSFWMSAEVSVKDPDGRRPYGSASRGARFHAELDGEAEVGELAAKRALGAIGAKKLASGVMPIVVDNRVGARLVSALLGPLSARALQQKQSFLDGKLGKPIASKLLTLTDDPLLPKGFASRLYDGEGFAAKKLTVIDKGVLKTYYVDDYYGRKLKLAPTTAGSSNLLFSLGKKGQAALLKDVKDGLFVSSFLGGNSNATTGDFSLGVLGNEIKGGQLAGPVSEINISGNLSQLWSKLAAVGDDPYPYSSTRTPTLVFDGVQVAGA